MADRELRLTTGRRGSDERGAAVGGPVAGSPFGSARAYVLLVLIMLGWGSNAVASWMAVGQIAPMMLTAGRWALVLIVLDLTFRRQVGCPSGGRGATDRARRASPRPGDIGRRRIDQPASGGLRTLSVRRRGLPAARR